MISALAGTGKTTTLTLLAEALPKAPSLALAFNRKIAKELESRFPPHFLVRTMNSLGHSCWARQLGRQPKLDDRKIGRLVTDLAKSSGVSLGEDGWDECRRLVSAAMSSGLVPSYFPMKGLIPDSNDSWLDLAAEADASPDWIELAREVLIASIKEGLGSSGPPTISFDDQLYLPTMLGGNFQKFSIVMVDEAQDLSPLQHLMVKKSATSRIIAVGDPRQAIYAFRGADSSSMENLRALRPSWIDLPLTLTFRCPKAVVARQQSHAPGYTAHESNLEGKVLDFRERGWSWEELPQGEIAVLCRLNAPLVSLALKLLAHRVPCVMLGRDLGKGLTSLAKKILHKPNLSVEHSRDLIEQWRANELDLAKANKKEYKSEAVNDKADCLLAVLAVSTSSGNLFKSLKEIFSNEVGRVTLATGHRAKGLEWQSVLHLDPFRIPSKFALRAGGPALEQELNLNYVIETRTKENLILANLKDLT